MSTVPQFKDRIREMSQSTGLGNFNLSFSTITGYTPYDFAFSNGTRVYYTIAHRSATEWEVGEGEVSSTTTLIRTRVIASSTGSKVNFSSGDKDVFFSIPSALLTNLQQPTHNLLINGGFRFFQRQAPGTATARSDDTYGPDRWYILTQTAAVNCERSTGDTHSLYAVKLTQNQATSQRCGIAQIIESDRTKPMRGRDFLAQLRIKCSASQDINIAVLEWTGTADAVTSDVVNSWTNATFTAGQFFNSTTLTITGTATITPSAATWTDLQLRGTLGSSANNIIVFVWTSAVAAQNVTLEITEAGFYEGKEPRIWLPRSDEEELRLCQRYYEKSYNVDVAPATTSSAAGADVFAGNVTNWPNGGAMGNTAFKVTKRDTPAVAPYGFNGGTPRASVYGSGADIACTPATVGQSGFGLSNNSGGDHALSGGGIFWHWTSESEL